MINSKKLDMLCDWEKIEEVNELLDSGVSPFKVHSWIVSNGFTISHPMVYAYARQRQMTVVEKVLGKHIPVIKQNEYNGKITNDRNALENILQICYNTLFTQEEK